jgi:hypothetical protein
MLNRIILFAALIGSAIAAENTAREVVYRTANPCRQGGCLAPVFYQGYLVQMKDYGQSAASDGYAVWGPDGNPLYQIDIVAPDGTPGHLRDVAIDTDGTAVVPITFGGPGHRGGGLVFVDSSGRQTQFIGTDGWLPAHVCFAQDHSIWVTGTQFAQDRVARGDFSMVRKYSRDGKAAGEFLQRSLFPPGLPPVEGGWIRAANDRIGVLTYPGMIANKPEWIELDLDGKLTGHWNLGPRSTGDPTTHNETYSLGELAFTSDGRLFAQPHDAVLKTYRIAIFDRATSSWQTVSDLNAPSAHSYLIGAEGQNLVFEYRNDDVRLTWVAVK